MPNYINITLNSTGGLDATLFDIYSDADGYTTPIASGISRTTLEAVYEILVPDEATIIKLTSTQGCTNSIFLNIGNLPTTTTSSTFPPAYSFAYEECIGASGSGFGDLIYYYHDGNGGFYSEAQCTSCC